MSPDEALENRRRMFRIGVALVIAGVVLVVVSCIIILFVGQGSIDPAVVLSAGLGVLLLIIGFALAGPFLIGS